MTTHLGLRMRAAVVTSALALGALAGAGPARAQSDPYERIAGQPIDRFAGHRQLGERDLETLSLSGTVAQLRSYDGSTATTPGVFSLPAERSSAAGETNTGLVPAMANAALVPQDLPDGGLRSNGREGIVTAGVGLGCSNGDVPGSPDQWLCLEYRVPGWDATHVVVTDTAMPTTPVQLAIGDFSGRGVPEVAIAWAHPMDRRITYAFFRLVVEDIVINGAPRKVLQFVEFGRSPATRVRSVNPVVNATASDSGFVLGAGDAMKTGRDQLVTFQQVSQPGYETFDVSVYDVVPGVDVRRVRQFTFSDLLSHELYRISLATPRVHPVPARVGAPQQRHYDAVVAGLSAKPGINAFPVGALLAIRFADDDGGAAEAGDVQYANVGPFHHNGETRAGLIAEAGDLDGDGIGDLVGMTARPQASDCSVAAQTSFGGLNNDGEWSEVYSQSQLATIAFDGDVCAVSSVAAADTRSLQAQNDAHAFLPNPDDASNAAPRIVGLVQTRQDGPFGFGPLESRVISVPLVKSVQGVDYFNQGEVIEPGPNAPDPQPITRLAPAGPNAGWSSATLTNLAAALVPQAYDGLVRVGEPKLTSVQTDEPLVLLNASPTQFDVFDGNVFDPNFCYGDNLFAVPEVCFFKSTYQRTVEASKEVTSEINDDWSVSTEASAGGGIGGIVDIEASLSANVGQEFSRTASSKSTTTVDVSVVAKNTDQAYVLHKQYDILEYPLYASDDDPGSLEDDEHMMSIRPVVTRRRWIDVNSQTSNIRGTHQTGQLLSYAKPEDIPAVPFKAPGSVTFGEDEFQITPTSDFTYGLTQEKVKTTGGSETFTWGIGASVSAEVDLGVSASLSVSGEYNHSETNTSTTSIGEKTRIEARMAQLDGSLGQMNYLVRPFAYYTRVGTLVLDYAVEPETSRDGIDTFWDRYYGNRPDPTMVLPNYQERERFGDRALTTDALQFRSKDIRFRESRSGVCQPQTLPAYEPAPGDRVCVDLTVRNYSLRELTSGTTVGFYAGDPDVGGKLITSQAIGNVPARGTREVIAQWTVPSDYGGGLQRIFARVDNTGLRNEIKEDNNKGFNVLRVGGGSPGHLFAPRRVFAQRVSDTSARVIWDAPSQSLPAGSSFEVRAYLDGDGSPKRTVTLSPSTIVPGNAYEATVSGISEAGNYRFAVAVKPSVGDPGAISDPSEPVSLEPGTPSAPTGLEVNGTGAQSLSWQEPESTGTVGGEPQVLTGYVATFRPTAGGTATVVETDASTRQTPIRDLVCGTQYEATVAAVNAQGTGTPSDGVTFTYTGPPPAPTGVAATVDPATGAVSVTWSASSASCGAITGYAVKAEPSGQTQDVSGTTTSATFTSLPLGTTQTFTVVAKSANGTSAPSDASTPVSIGRKAAAPTATATAGNGKVTVTWSPPADTGGSAVTSYVVRLSASGSPVVALVEGKEASARSHTFADVEDGREHTWSVAAVNVIGEGVQASGVVTPLGPPSAPQRVAATGGDGEATVTWDAPDRTGGSPITKYVVQGTPSGSIEVAPSLRTATITGLTNGQRFTFTVRAVTAVATGPVSSASNEVLVAGAPGAPGAVTADSRDRALRVHWDAANPRGGTISGYRVELRATDGEVRITTTIAADRQALVGDLRNGVAYMIEVVAFGPLGEGPAGTGGPVTPATVPGQPREITAVDGDAQVTVGWLAPTSDGGAPVTAYRIRMLPSDVVVEVAGEHRQVVVTGLANGQPTRATVTAINRQGAGPDSPESPVVTPAAVPGKPTGVTAQRGDQKVTVRWTAPVDDGGAAISSYRIRVLPGDTVLEVDDETAREAIVSPLPNGQPVTVTVSAVNRRGVGPASDPSPEVTPATVPTVPTSLVVRKSVGRVDVSWNPPTSNGGSPITSYYVTATAGGRTQQVSTSGRTATFSGLQYLGTTTVKVHAINALGSSPPATVTK